MFTARLTSPRTRRTATLAVRTADILAGTVAGKVTLGGARTLCFRASVKSDEVEVTGGEATLVLNGGALDSRDLDADETAEMLAAAQCMWKRNRSAIAALRVEALRAKAAELLAEGDADKAARLEAAAA